jgi:hypothetical protein
VTFVRGDYPISYHEDLQPSPRRLMADVFAFLGADAHFVPDPSRRHNEPVIPRLNPVAYYPEKVGRADIARLAVLLDRDVSGWFDLTVGTPRAARSVSPTDSGLQDQHQWFFCVCALQGIEAPEPPAIESTGRPRASTLIYEARSQDLSK